VVPPLNDSDELLSELKAARLDVALLVRPESGGSRRLVWRELHRQPYVMLAPPNATGKNAKQLLEAHDWVGYDLSLAGGRVAARYVRSLVPGARCVMELRSMDAIVAMVAQGLGVSVVPQPRRALVRACAVREVGLGSRAPFRKLSLVWRTSDEGSRNVEAVAQAFSAAFEARPAVGLEKTFTRRSRAPGRRRWPTSPGSTPACPTPSGACRPRGSGRCT
jgi:DNA-binding transcriptional LysR family regulator